MQVYDAPLRDMKFALRELHADDGFTVPLEHDDDLVDAVLEEAARVNREVLLPLNRTGDEEGCISRMASFARPPASRRLTTSSARAAGRRSPPIRSGAGRVCPSRSTSSSRR